jgi:hypothetical protein
MDGRTQLPVNEWLRRRYGAEFVDTVTEPGPVRLLASGGTDASENIRRRIGISVGKHGSSVVAVVAHHDCAGNPAAEAQQLEQLKIAVELVGTWFAGVEVIGLWLGKDWQVVEKLSWPAGGQGARKPRA